MTKAPRAHTATWPLYPTYVPSVTVGEALQAISKVPAKQLCLRRMHAHAWQMRYMATPNQALNMQYWSLPNAEGDTACMNMDSRYTYDPGDGDEVMVLAPLLWALLSAIRCLQSKVAPKRVWNIRVRNVKHGAWSRHKRIGSPTEAGAAQRTSP